MVVGIGIDVVDLVRFERALRRTPRLRERLFTEREREQSGASLAARFAAKEAALKALGGIPGFRWHDIEVLSVRGERPTLALYGDAARIAAALGVNQSHLSLSHDGGIATAMVLMEAVEAAGDGVNEAAPPAGGGSL